MTFHATAYAASQDPASAAQQLHARSQICERSSRLIGLLPQYAQTSREVCVNYLRIGAAHAPVVVVQGGISAGRDACSSSEHAARGWWQEQVGAGYAIDLRQYQVLAIDWLAAGDLDAPAVSSFDQAEALAGLLDALHIERVHAYVGASYGGMVGLAFAARHGRRLGRLLAIAGAHRADPLAGAQRAVQRNMVRFGLETGHVDEALSLARQLAMTTYRGREEFRQRFSGDAEFRDGRFHLPAEDWLAHAGARFVDRFDARRYLSLSESIDLHCVQPAQIKVSVSLIGIASDRVVPLADLCALQRELGSGASLSVIESPYGHDAFLKETAQLAPLLREFLQSP
jgi:homoserine O-acetyltransferase